ncbi:hypothetical protein KIPB_011468 [Kipferlia bialata]|uniref:Uncharacterized protein n=1 Tax=Kipferlia bialata TaxID=797122 RepID=A0A391NX31_9EUKA|nr:hypothetical protein KIPB_011468 [Kipferlia bialata]|eukprot:g11468.t1
MADREYTYEDAHSEPMEAMSVQPCTLHFPLYYQENIERVGHTIMSMLHLESSTVILTMKDDPGNPIEEFVYEIKGLVNRHQPHIHEMTPNYFDGSYVSPPSVCNGYMTHYSTYADDKERQMYVHLLDDLTAPRRVIETHSTQFINDDGVIVRLPGRMSMDVHTYMEETLACTLDGQCVFVPREQASDNPTGVCIYNAESEVWTEDSRVCPDIGETYAHTVVDDTLHVFVDSEARELERRERESRVKHWTYNMQSGWREIQVLPRNVSEVGFAQTMGRLILLGCATGVQWTLSISMTQSVGTGAE